MEWLETGELPLVDETVRRFAAVELEGEVFDLDGSSAPTFPRAALDGLAELGFLWGPAPEDVGSDMEDLACVVVLAGLARTCAGFAAIVASHYAALRALLSLPGGAEISRRLAGDRGTGLLGIALERDVRPFDEKRLSRERARALGDGPVEFLALPAPDLVDAVVLPGGRAADGSLFLADGAALAAKRGAPVGLSGCEEMPVARLELAARDLQAGEELARGKNAVAARGAAVSSLKLYYSAIMYGAARDAAECALVYTRQRRQTGRPICMHQNVHKKLLETDVSNQAMASFLYRVASGGETGGAFGLVDMLYAFVRERSEVVVSEALQNMGGLRLRPGVRDREEAARRQDSAGAAPNRADRLGGGPGLSPAGGPLPSSGLKRYFRPLPDSPWRPAGPSSKNR